ncbi:MAG: tetratricopeptide repeat protein [Aestuariivirga sp.]
MRGIGLGLAFSILIAVPAFGDGMRVPSEATSVPFRQKSPAESRSDRLDALLARLHQEVSLGEAKSAEQDIWAIWMASDSPTAEILLRQATRAMNEGAPEPALAILNRLTGAYPDFAEAWNKRATLHFIMGNDQASLADIDHVLELEPRHFGALSGRGMIEQRRKNYGAAMRAFNEALAINPNMPSVKDAVKELEKLERGI